MSRSEAQIACAEPERCREGARNAPLSVGRMRRAIFSRASVTTGMRYAAPIVITVGSRRSKFVPTQSCAMRKARMHVKPELDCRPDRPQDRMGRTLVAAELVFGASGGDGGA